MLVDELYKHFDEIKSNNQGLTYYNELLGDTSFLLAGLLGSLLKQKYGDWHSKRWIDDSLITKVVEYNNEINIEGIMIWGKENTTEQWTSPFSFKINLAKNQPGFKKFTFLFCHAEDPEISYEEFKVNGDVWNKGRKWKYVIDSIDI